jgi:rhodanese-related sulfurtransferase
MMAAIRGRGNDMTIRQATPAQTHEAMTAAPDSTYLDVRTEAEFAQSHPAGALNVPVVFLEPGSPAKPNPAFLDVVRRHLDPAAKIYVGCQSGGRSQRAAEILVGAGYSDITNVSGGFGGARDRSGAVVVQGWRDAGLPTESGQPADRSYRDLVAKG